MRAVAGCAVSDRRVVVLPRVRGPRRGRRLVVRQVLYPAACIARVG